MSEKEAFVYILLCADKSLYTGYTTDLNRRIKMHNSKLGAKYTRNRLPVEYVFTYKCPDKKTAMRLEAGIKKLSKKKKEALIKGLIAPSYILNN